MQQVYIVNTGFANLASVKAALERIDATPIVTESKVDIQNARFLILPGVGNFGAAIEKLSSAALIETLRKRFQSGLPTLSICLGFQLLAKASEEDNNCIGLGAINSEVIRLKTALPVPQIGWNKVIPDAGCSMIKPGFAYFANSFAYVEIDDGWNKSYFAYENRYIAAIERDNLLACQFHPELSGEYGQNLLKQWIRRGISQ